MIHNSINETLTTVDFKNAWASGVAITEPVEENTTLTSTRSWKNWFGEPGSVAFAGALE